MLPQQKIEQYLDTLLAEETAYFKVGFKVKPTNNYKILIDGDNGITIEKCVFFNRKLYRMIEEELLYPEGDFSLEISSPGVTEPLKLLRQYHRNIGREVEVALNDETKKIGKLITVTEENITIEETTGKGKKAVTTTIIIPFGNIKTTTVQISFKL